MLMGGQIEWIWQNSFRQDTWFNGLVSGDINFFVCLLNILNKSVKHFLPFHDSFHGLEAHIHLDFHLEKYIFIIAFTPG